MSFLPSLGKTTTQEVEEKEGSLCEFKSVQLRTAEKVDSKYY